MRDRRVADLKPGDQVVCPNRGRVEVVTSGPVRVEDLYQVTCGDHTHRNLFASFRFRLA